MQLLTLKEMLPKMDKRDYIQSSVIFFFSFLVLTLGKFLEALGTRIGTCSIFCHSFSLSNNVRAEILQMFWFIFWK